MKGKRDLDLSQVTQSKLSQPLVFQYENGKNNVRHNKWRDIDKTNSSYDETCHRLTNKKMNNLIGEKYFPIGKGKFNLILAT